MSNQIINYHLRKTYHQIRPWQPHKGADWLHIEEEDSTHYNPLVDRQIRVPIGDINKLRKKLREEDSLFEENIEIEEEQELNRELEEGQILTRKPKM